MNVLTLNAGSSTLKYKLFGMPEEAVLEQGQLDHPGGEGVTEAAVEAIDRCRAKGIDALGHRVVHGGTEFSWPTRITRESLPLLRSLKSLDPLHNPKDVAIIDAGLRLIPDVPAVAVFDTGFHSTLPESARLYGLPWEVSEKLGLRRYGFHGISYKYVSGELLQCLGRGPLGTRLIVCHLGSGSSVCALRDGESVDTSMGMTPLEGVMMGTRSGDVDPGVLFYLMRSGGMTMPQVDEMLNRKSGLLGVSGVSSDVRELETAAAGGNTRAESALALYAYRVRGYIGSYAAALGGIDALAFTGGIGEHSASVRSRICERLDFLGIRHDAARNANPPDGPALLSAGPIPIWRIPTDEERQIAREVVVTLGA